MRLPRVPACARAVGIYRPPALPHSLHPFWTTPARRSCDVTLIYLFLIFNFVYRAPPIQRMYRCMLGGPFFTTVPSGRVGRARDSAYFSNEAFVQGVRRSERDDQVRL